MKTLKDLKDRLKVGETLTLIYFGGNQHAGLNIPRKIIKVQSNAIQLEGINGKDGSWVYFPRRCEVEFHETNENKFRIHFKDMAQFPMVYYIGENVIKNENEKAAGLYGEEK
jgi:hypothetical protein